MRQDERNIGAREGLLDEKHRRAMGPARHLFDWLLARQTTERQGVGLVLGGAPLVYARITAETGWPARTLRRWMARLVERQYVQVSHVDRNRMMIAILRAKKFKPCGLAVQKPVDCGGNPVHGGDADRPKVAQLDRPKVAELNPLVLMCGKKELREKESQPQETAATTAVPAPAVQNEPQPPPVMSGAEMAQHFAREAEAGRTEFLAGLRRLARTHALPRLTLTPRQFALRQRELERQRDELRRRGPPQAGAA